MKVTILKQPWFWLVLLFILTRFSFLTRLPVFNDEAIYLDWGWRSVHEPGNLFFSLYDGKQPFFFWLLGFAQKILPAVPLFSGRVVSVLFSAAAVIGIYKLTTRIANKQTGLLAVLLYLTSPLYVFFDRQALAESAITCISIWTTYTFLEMSEANTKNVLLLCARLSVFIAMGLFIKSSFLLLVIALMGALLWQSGKSERQVFFKNFSYSLYIAALLLTPLLMQPSFWTTLGMNQRYVFGWTELLRFPLKNWGHNVRNIMETLLLYLPVSGLFLFASVSKGFRLSLRSRFPVALLKVLLVQAMLLGALVVTARGVHPRYIVSATALLPTLFAFCIQVWTQPDHTQNATNSKQSHRARKTIRKAVVAVFGFALPAICSSILILNPLLFFRSIETFSAMAQSQEYVTNWTAGYAATSAIQYIREQAAAKSTSKILIATRTDAGNPESAVRFSFQADTRFTPFYFDEHTFPGLDKYSCLAATIPVFFVSRDQHLAGQERFWQEEARFYNPGNSTSVGVYSIKYPCVGETLTLEANE